MRQGWGYVKAAVEVEIETGLRLRLRQGWDWDRVDVLVSKAAVEVEERPELANRHQSLRSLLHNTIIKSLLHNNIIKSLLHNTNVSSNLLHNTIVSSNLSPEPPQHHYFAKSIQSPQYESILQNILHVPTTSLLTKFLQAPRLASSREISLQSPHNGTFHSFIQAQRWSREISFKTQQQDHSFNSFQKLPKVTTAEQNSHMFK